MYSRRELLLAFAVCIVSYAAGQSCPELYKRYSEKHTYCLPPNPSCDIIASSVSPKDQEYIVQLHNELRSKVAMGKESIGNLPSASDMLQMEWDDELARVAQAHANQCNFAHDCNECRQIKDFSVGQNLYQSWVFGNGEQPKPAWKQAVQLWYDEVKNFDKTAISPYQPYSPAGATGHFTQVIWAKTWKVGCGYSLFKKQGTTYQLYTCNYGPAGNMMDASVYTVGKPCSHCPINSCCGKTCTDPPTYDGLCKILDNEAPKYSQTSDYTYFCDFEDYSKCLYTTPSDMKQWELSHTLSGSYLGIVLSGGETTLLNFTQPFVGEDPMCMSVKYRKGPNIAGEASGGVAKEYFNILEPAYGFEVTLSSDSSQFMAYGMNTNWNSKFYFSLSFSVPEGMPAQYLELKEISLKKGHC